MRYENDLFSKETLYCLELLAWHNYIILCSKIEFVTAGFSGKSFTDKFVLTYCVIIWVTTQFRLMCV